MSPQQSLLSPLPMFLAYRVTHHCVTFRARSPRWCVEAHARCANFRARCVASPIGGKVFVGKSLATDNESPCRRCPQAGAVPLAKS